ncbi:3-oxoadipate enol-lactonase [Pseudohoeflea coraliihabitans]|uniref:3-oxoadipate enol-lactonase n=1 Tax=Pseudohoeflea coraliihabitans TaxID=2860393 RepID=A0ABS6WKB4_9HYPH|nr:3-oxoadipate enol-lactonase [Pseudohoeflea sp. DP4N28-3]MBW3096397.1 3-oxoadipate enol-lactonase [Pseudohoeflea sp. DP4N28-3]
MQFASLNGVTLHHQVIGAKPDRPTVVFINALGTDFRIWRDVIIRLAGEYGLITYDKRGHGLSETGASLKMDDHVADLAAVIDHYGAKDVILCGLSVGGQIALGLSERRPDLVRALILCDTAPRIGTEDMWDARIAAIAEGGMAALSDTILERWFTKEFRRADNAEFTGYRMMLERCPVPGYLGTCEAIRDTDFTAIAAGLAKPAICVVGAEDGSTPPEQVGGMAKLIPGARYQPIPGAAHLPCVEKPVELSEIIRAFVEQLPQS